MIGKSISLYTKKVDTPGHGPSCAWGQKEDVDVLCKIPHTFFKETISYDHIFCRRKT